LSWKNIDTYITHEPHEPQLSQKTSLVLLELNFWNAAKYLKGKFNFRWVWQQEGKIAVKTHGKSKRQIVASVIHGKSAFGPHYS
jgi:hypothetical protein